jgi:hypothetical protein
MLWHCTVCGRLIDQSPLEFRQAEDHVAFCSFECTIAFALDRIRQRREYPNQEIEELWRQLQALQKRPKNSK